jgi:hypothetical protein
VIFVEDHIQAIVELELFVRDVNGVGGHCGD